MAATQLSSAEVLTFSYWDDAKPPFVIEKDEQVASGIIHDLAEVIASSLDLKAEFLKLPVARIESQLQNGNIDLDCLTSPIWKSLPGAYHWSPKLFEGQDRFLVRHELKSKIRSFSDLKGLTLGIYNGYVYHPEVMALIDSGEVTTVKVKGLEHGIQLLQLGRMDVLVDFGILLEYELRKPDLSQKLSLADFPADQYNLHCAYSKKMDVSAEGVDAIIRELINSGQLNKILDQYR
jgi:ABC-type amino acid transport substrate-binding protein